MSFTHSPSFSGVRVVDYADVRAILRGIHHGVVEELHEKPPTEELVSCEGSVFAFKKIRHRWKDGSKWGSGSRMRGFPPNMKAIRYKCNGGRVKFCFRVDDWRIIAYGASHIPAACHPLLMSLVDDGPHTMDSPSSKLSNHRFIQVIPTSSRARTLEPPQIHSTESSDLEPRSANPSDHSPNTDVVINFPSIDVPYGDLGVLEPLPASLLTYYGPDVTVDHPNVPDVQPDKPQVLLPGNYLHPFSARQDAIVSVSPSPSPCMAPYLDLDMLHPSVASHPGDTSSDSSSQSSSPSSGSVTLGGETSSPSSSTSEVTSSPSPTTPDLGTLTVESSTTQWAGCFAPFIYPTLFDPLCMPMASFFRQLSSCHSYNSTCFAAMQKFVIEGQGQARGVIILAVVRENLDHCTSLDPHGYDINYRIKVVEEETLDPVPAHWLSLQISAQHFNDERSKSAIWTFGALAPGDKSKEASTFRWLKQERFRIPTKNGSRVAMDITSGDNVNYPLSPLHRLRCQLTHSANAEIREDLLIHMENDYRAAIGDDCEEWLIALHHNILAPMTDAKERNAIIDAHLTYMKECVYVEEAAFKAAGYTSCLHVCRNEPCDHIKPTFVEIVTAMEDTCEWLKEHFKQPLEKWPTKIMRQLSRRMGDILYFCRHAYALLSPEEYDRYHAVSFPCLNFSRAKIRCFERWYIWNYLPFETKEWARNRRIELGSCIA